jgi:hypothetical protein
MISLRLVRLIEAHSTTLSDSLVEKLRTSSHTQGLRGIPSHELRERCLEIYSHLSDWLLHKSSADVELRFQSIGELRARQGVPLGDVVWGLFLTKEHLWSFLERQGFSFGPVELHSQLELLRLLDRFFDHAIYHLTIGYEFGRTTQHSSPETGKPHREDQPQSSAEGPPATL